ncbi:hypothetical protein GNS53_14145 [Vibrio cholerae]|nr:hypothetical protein [Vibrio cholerae]EGR4136831.1 hypothetical protein [Vibrio cholerae]ELN6874490.1 hypothetical protein [Vibrio cholerae]
MNGKKLCNVLPELPVVKYATSMLPQNNEKLICSKPAEANISNLDVSEVIFPAPKPNKFNLFKLKSITYEPKISNVIKEIAIDINIRNNLHNAKNEK